MEGWFPRLRGEHTRQRIAMRGCLRTQFSGRNAQTDFAAAPAESRARFLNSRPPSQNGSRRPDRRICGDRGSTSCAPTLWKEKQAGFFECPINNILSSRTKTEGNCPAAGRGGANASPTRPQLISPAFCLLAKTRAPSAAQTPGVGPLGPIAGAEHRRFQGVTRRVCSTRSTMPEERRA